MKKTIILLAAAFASWSAAAQTFNFSNDPATSGWTVVNTPGVGWTWDNPNDEMDYNITTGTGNNFLHRPTPFVLGDQFSVSFRLRTGANQNNTFFPLMLTPNALAGPANMHPWRLDPTPAAGALQNIDLLGVGITNQRVSLLARLGNTGTGLTSFTNPLDLTANTSYWFLLERICETTVRLRVFSNAAMTTTLRDETFTIPSLANMSEIYIANCNGNSSTNQTGSVDDYTFGDSDNTCCAPNSINGPNIICSPSEDAQFNVDVTGNIQNLDWTISPSTGVSSSENGSLLTVTQWGSASTYTITFTWTCNCVEQTLTKIVTVYPDLAETIDGTATCDGTPNSLDFSYTASGSTPPINRLWQVWQAANFTPGNCTTTGGMIDSQNGGSSFTRSNWNQANAYVIRVTSWYEGTNCDSVVTCKKVLCATKSADAGTTGTTTAAPPIKAPVIFPNPTSRDLFLQLPEKHGIAHVQIVDASGKIVAEQPVTDEQLRLTFSIEHVDAGIYTVIYTGTATYAPEKFIKK